MFFVVPAALVFSQTVVESPSLKLDFPVFDLPYQIDAANIFDNFFESYTHPSMDQTLNVTNTVFSSLHFGMKKLKDVIGSDAYWKRFVYYGGVGLGDFLLYSLPIPTGYMWMHESFHVAGFTYAGHRSHLNYAFPNGAYAVADSGELSNWSAEYRTLAAGMESEYLLVEKMQRNNFFYDQNLPNEFFYWLTNYQAWGYAYQPLLIDEMKMTVDGKEETVYPDSQQWTYFLFHPEGVPDESEIHLSDNEKDFLKNRVMLSLINVASPMMFGIRSIPLGAETGWYGNFAFRHLYTSFGTDLVFNVYLKNAPFNMAFAYHSYLNYEHYFPAIEAELIDFPFRLGRLDLLLSPRLMIGAQPKNQEFMTADPEFFGMAGCRVDFAISRHVLPYIEFSMKTNGWVAGNEYLKGTFGGKAGVSLRF
jgi:hypothetical protein